jgi:hypothetical protein
MGASRQPLLPRLLITLVTACAGTPPLASACWQPGLRKAGHAFE